MYKSTDPNNTALAPLLALTPLVALALLASGCASSSSTASADRAGSWTGVPAVERASGPRPDQPPASGDRTPATSSPRRTNEPPTLPGLPAASPSSALDERRNDLLDVVASWMGVPYRYGGSSMSGVDCSAFVQHVFRQGLGLRLPRTTEAQRSAGTVIDASEIGFGDLVFFRITPRQGHVGVVIAPGEFAHASTSSGVTTSRLDDPYWRSRFDRAVRFDPEIALATPAPVKTVPRRLTNVSTDGADAAERRRGW